MGLGGQRHAPSTLLQGETRYTLYRRLGGPQDRSRRVRKMSSPPRFDPRTVQPVASRYTDWSATDKGNESLVDYFLEGVSKVTKEASIPTNGSSSLAYWLRDAPPV